MKSSPEVAEHITNEITKVLGGKQFIIFVVDEIKQPGFLKGHPDDWIFGIEIMSTIPGMTHERAKAMLDASKV